MDGELSDLSGEGIDDKMDVFGWHPFDRLLDNMVAVLIFHTFENVVLEFFDQTGLLIGEYVLKRLTHVSYHFSLQVCSSEFSSHFLYNSTSVHLQGQVQDLTLHFVREDLLHVLVAMLEELLNDVVSKDVGHQLHRISLNLLEDPLFLVAVGRLELLLNETGAVLIPTELDYVIVDVLQMR